MARTAIAPTGVEKTFHPDQIIVSKTDRQGRLTYVNDLFVEISGYPEAELIGKPHNVIRHPDMPRSVFWLLWDRIAAGQEIFAYVVNLTKFGDHYWVFAHVTPSFDEAGNIVGFHSNRRAPDRKGVQSAQALYKVLLEEEQRYADRRKGMLSATELLQSMLADKQVEYDQFVFTL